MLSCFYWYAERDSFAFFSPWEKNKGFATVKPVATNSPQDCWI